MLLFQKRPGEELPAGQKAHLTPRECEVLALAAVGKSASMIAKVLAISERSAAAHTADAMRKLGAPNETAAVAWALQARLIDLDPRALGLAP